MANKYLLDTIKIEGILVDVIARSTGENVTVKVDGQDTTLAAALASILTNVAALPTTENVTSAISTAIDNLIGGAPDTYDTLKELADYIASHEDVVSALNAAIGGKVSKEDGKGLSANDFTDALKTKLDGLKLVTASSTNGNILIDGVETPVYIRPEGEGVIRTGTVQPADMKNGDVFFRILS